MRLKLRIGLMAMLLFVSSTSLAGFSLGLRGGLFIPTGWMDTHDAVYDSSGAMAFGIEGAYSFKIPVELVLALDFIHESGERVWPDGSGGWDKSGESIAYDMIPVTLTARWRFIQDAVVEPYIGAGLGYVLFEEDGDDQETGLGFVLHGGSDFQINRSFFAFAELEYSAFSSVIGNDGVSRYYDEDDVGGVTVRAGVRFRF